MTQPTAHTEKNLTEKIRAAFPRASDLTVLKMRALVTELNLDFLREYHGWQKTEGERWKKMEEDTIKAARNAEFAVRTRDAEAREDNESV